MGLRALDDRLSWDHNAFHHRWLLRQLPARPQQVLEIGCGAGTLAARLAQRANHVDALDIAPAIVDAALSRVPANVTVRLADTMTEALPAAHYDAVVSSCVLHHLPLGPALERLAATLRPGGVLAAIALPATDLPREAPAELAAIVGHRALGASFLLARTLTGGGWFAHEPTHAAMPMVLDPALTTAAVRREARTVLPGCTVRRLVLWRCGLVWRKPGPERPAPGQPSPG